MLLRRPPARSTSPTAAIATVATAIQTPTATPAPRTSHAMTLTLTVLAALVAMLLVPATPAAAATPDATAESDLHRFTDNSRCERGLAPLTRSSELDRLARAHAVRMADAAGGIWHSGNTGVGENVGVSSDGSLLRVYDALLASSGHRANILGDYGGFGAGVARSSGGAIYVVQVFSRGSTTATCAQRAVTHPTPSVSTTSTSPTQLTFGCPSTVPTVRYLDVAASSAHARAIGCLGALRIEEGYPGRIYRPDHAATRAEFAGALHAMLTTTGALSARTSSSSGRFSDVPSSHPHRDAIEALAAAGIVSGTTATTFSPDRRITRGQLASLLTGAIEAVAGTSLPTGRVAYSDTAGTTHEASIAKLTASGLGVGYPDGTYRPTRSITRAQLATFVARTMDRLVTDGEAALPRYLYVETRTLS